MKASILVAAMLLSGVAFAADHGDMKHDACAKMKGKAKEECMKKHATTETAPAAATAPATAPAAPAHDTKK